VPDPDWQRCIFILDEPHYHRVRWGETHRFRGVALSAEGPEVETVGIYGDGKLLLETAASLPSPDIERLVHRPRAARCRFAGELRIESGPPLQIRGRRADGREVPLFSFNLPLVAAEGARLAALWRDVQRLPAPPPELVERTQGGRNEASYRDSIVSGVTTLEALLRAAGAPPNGIRSVLDIGCGTGRLLLGCHLAEPRRRLVGVDIEPELVGWTRRFLPRVADWRLGTQEPPLDLPAASFDLVLLVSVLTHLPLGLQRAWLAEVRRLLRPGGWALVTLHGDVYASLLLGAAQQEAYASAGYLEAPGGPAGSNAFATFHRPAMARELFEGFDRLVFFPRGCAGERTPDLFPLASLQDIYLLRAAETKGEPS
jgi:SAM-dependent methyltransferase